MANGADAVTTLTEFPLKEARFEWLPAIGCFPRHRS